MLNNIYNLAILYSKDSLQDFWQINVSRESLKNLPGQHLGQPILWWFIG